MSLAPAASIRSSKEPASDLASPALVGDSAAATYDSTDAKFKKRGLAGLAQKCMDDKTADHKMPPTSEPMTVPGSQPSTSRAATASPIQLDTPQMGPSSPSRGLYASSTHFGSPATSQIFERDVQDSAAIPNSPAIPSHIQTENHIPPVLDASSEAITDGHLNPDAVEIVTHNSHQPAGANVATSPLADAASASASWIDDLSALADKEESASNYGSLDSADVRRLSFISFADVVQSEHGPPPAVAGSRESMPLAGLTSLSSMGVNRSPSPIRSPVSSQGPETSPPNSKSGSVKGLSMSPARKSLASPMSMEHSTSASGDLSIETMSQALRRTGSTDLGANRSVPISPIEGPSR